MRGREADAIGAAIEIVRTLWREDMAAVVRQVMAEELDKRASQAPVVEMIDAAQFAREHSITPATVRTMISDGRIAAADVTRIGKRWRVRRDAQIDQHRRAPSLNAEERALQIWSGK